MFFGVATAFGNGSLKRLLRFESTRIDRRQSKLVYNWEMAFSRGLEISSFHFHLQCKMYRIAYVYCMLI